MKLFQFAIVCCALCAGSLPAQRTWIVDANGGGDFTDIPPAIAAASDGDTILVKPVNLAGGYNIGCSTSKALTILGEEDSMNQQGAFVWGILSLTNLPAGRRFVIKGVSSPLAPIAGWAKFSATDCAGSIVFEDSSFADFRAGSAYNWRPSVTLERCSNVSFTNCVLIGHPALQVTDSVVSLCSTDVHGNNGDAWSKTSAEYAIEALRSRITMGYGYYSGGDGSDSGWYEIDPEAAVHMTDSDVIVTGDANTAVIGGRYAQPTGPGGPTWAFIGKGGSIVYNPVTNIPGIANVTLQGGVVRADAIPALTATGAPPGQKVQVDLLGAPNAAAAILVSLPVPPLRLPFGDVWIDPSLNVLVFSGSLSSTGQAQLQIPVSKVYPLGLPWTFQAATLDSSKLRVSNPSTIVLY